MISFPLPHQPSSIIYTVIRELEPHLDIKNGPWVAGGSLRRLLCGDYRGYFDIDIFVRDVEQAIQIKQIRNKISTKLSGKFKSTPDLSQDEPFTTKVLGSITKNVAIQVIGDEKLFFASPEALIDDFDFTICQFVTDGRMVWCSDRALEDLTSSTLSLNGSAKIRNTSRVLKYCSMGYVPDSNLMDRIGEKTGVYYHAEGPEFFQIHDGLDRIRDFGDNLVLSKIAGCIFGIFEDQDMVILNGIPFPVHLGYVWLTSESARHDIKARLSPFWSKHGINYDAQENVASLVPFDQFREGYKSRMTSTTRPVPRSSPATASRVSAISSVKIVS